LVGGAVGLLSYTLVPAGVDRFYRVQEDRARSAAKQLDELYTWVEKKKLLRLYLVLPPILGILGLVFFKLVGLVIGAGIGLVLPSVFIKQKEANRRRLLRSQLVDTLMIMSGSLKAGLSLLQSMEAVVQGMPPPISQEISYVLKEVHMGRALDEALCNFKERVRLDDVDLIVTTILVARDTGGNLTETFSQLVSTIRETQKLVGKVRVLCTQAKLQGIIMSLLPVGFCLFLYLKNRQLFSDMLELTIQGGVPIGRILLIGSFFWWLIGVFFIRKFSRVEV